MSEHAYISGSSYYLLSGPVLLEAMMTDLATLDQSLVTATDLEPDELVRLLGAGLAGVDDGELFLEYRETESLAFDDGRLKSASFDASRGFGLRAVAGEAIGYAHSPDLSQSALRRAIDAVQPVKRGYAGTLALPPHGTNRKRYGEDNPIQGRDQAIKIGVLEQIDAYARAKEPRVKQVSATISGSWQRVEIVRPDGARRTDVRPLVRLNVAVVVGDGRRMATCSSRRSGAAWSTRRCAKR